MNLNDDALVRPLLAISLETLDVMASGSYSEPPRNRSRCVSSLNENWGQQHLKFTNESHRGDLASRADVTGVRLHRPVQT